jgi:hypothetical protein
MKINWGTMPDWVIAVSAVVTAVTAVVSAVLAFKNLRSWRSQKGYEIASELQLRSDELRRAVSRLRGDTTTRDEDRKLREAVVAAHTGINLAFDKASWHWGRDIIEQFQSSVGMAVFELLTSYSTFFDPRDGWGRLTPEQVEAINSRSYAIAVGKGNENDIAGHHWDGVFERITAFCAQHLRT